MISEIPQEVVDDWIDGLLDCVRSSGLNDALGQLRAGLDSHTEMVQAIETSVYLAASSLMSYSLGDLAERANPELTARWLYGLAWGRAEGDLPYDEWLGAVRAASGDVSGAIASDPIRRIKAYVVLVSMLETGEKRFPLPVDDLQLQAELLAGRLARMVGYPEPPNRGNH